VNEILEVFNSIRTTINRGFSSLSSQQRKLLFVGLPFFASLFALGLYVIRLTSFGTLYANISQSDGAAVVRELEAQKIPYRLRRDGTVIEVPKDVLYRTRLNLAGKGMPSGGGVGFEIFEKSTFGMSEFTQRVNYLRALQGEISRTVNSLEAVQSSRVHIAMPSRSAFLGPEEKPSASVVIQLKAGSQLSPDQVQGIVNLVTTSVQGLSSEKVTVVDTLGRLLTANQKREGTSEPEILHDLKAKFEEEMEHRIETMLIPVLGSGKAVARVNIQLNFQATHMTREAIEPGASTETVPASEKTAAPTGGVPGVQSNVPPGNNEKPEAAATKQAAAAAAANQKELSRTTSEIIEPRGQIRRLSVAVLVDGKYEANKYVPRTAQEIELLKGIVMRTVGFNADRGDQLEVANIPFKVEPPAPALPAAAPDYMQMLTTPQGMGAAAGAGLLIFFALFMLMRKKKPKTAEVAEAASQQIAKETVPALTEAAPAGEKIEISPEARREQIASMAKEHQEASVRLLRGWLQEDEERKKLPGNNGHVTEAAVP